MDTPGFDDTFRKDIDILRNIAGWLGDTYSHDITLSGIIYLHRIQDNRMQGAAMKNLRMFRKLVGNDGLKNVFLVTTMWNNVSQQEGIDREKELRESPEFWKAMVDKGSKILRQEHGPVSSYHIVQQLMKRNTRVTLDIQRDMVDNKMSLADTAAGAEVQLEEQKLRAAWAEERKQLEKDQREALATRDREAQREIAAAKAELEVRFQQSNKNFDLLQASTSDLRAQIERQGSDMFRNQRHVEQLQANNKQLSSQVEYFVQEKAVTNKNLQQLVAANENLNSQLQGSMKNQEVVDFLKAKFERKERRFYRKYNPWHVKFDVA
jgi:chromosome segregation ATPase